MKTALTIAGSDSGGGAGIQADIKTFAAHGVFGLTAITAVTAQNTRAVVLSAALAPHVVAAQIDAVAGDFPIGATKIGMLANAGIAATVADAVERHALVHVVLDPILRATSGDRLLDQDGMAVMRSRLMPLAQVVTPNIAEAEALSGLEIRTRLDVREAAVRLIALGSRAVIVKGGHLDGPPVDVVYEDGVFTELTGPRLDSHHTHGTGCTFSAALAARLARGDNLVAAARAAKAYVAAAIQRAPNLGHGRGRGPLGHF